MKTIAVIKFVKTLQIQSKETGEAARKERQARKISLREVARRLQVSAAYISDLELGHRKWKVEMIRAYEKALERP